MTHRSARATEIREDVFSDPDLSPRLKLFTLAAIHLWETKPERRELKQFGKESWPHKALRLAGETGTTEELSMRLWSLIRDDVPKYRMNMREKIVCCGTMLRPAGAPCTKRTSITTSIPNPLTGERRWFGACSNPRHREQFETESKAAVAAWRTNGAPAPKPNSGGLLLRYFTTGIEALYAWADRDYRRGETATPPPTPTLAGIVSLDDRRRARTTRTTENTDA